VGLEKDAGVATWGVGWKLQHTATHCNTLQYTAVPPWCYSMSQSAAVCCSVLQCTAVRCSVLQCVAVWCSVLPWAERWQCAMVLKQRKHSANPCQPPRGDTCLIHTCRHDSCMRLSITHSRECHGSLHEEQDSFVLVTMNASCVWGGYD